MPQDGHRAFSQQAGPLTVGDGDMLPADRDFAIAVPIAGATVPAGRRVGVICHIFYLEALPDIAAVIARCPEGTGVHVTTDSTEKQAAIGAALSNVASRLEVRVCPNRGRDIAPKVVGMADVYSGYDYLLFLHSKKSIHTEGLAGWRDFIFENLAGSPETVASVLSLFEADPGLGMVGPQHLELVRDWCRWSDNFVQCRTLARAWGIVLLREALIDLPSGSMFWARPAALEPLLRLGLRWDDFPAEAGQVDGTLAHAIERMIYFCCESAGYRWVKVADPRLCKRIDTVLPLGGALTLDRFCRERAASLTTPPFFGWRFSRARPESSLARRIFLVGKGVMAAASPSAGITAAR